jgi:hypothetical protein
MLHFDGLAVQLELVFGLVLLDFLGGNDRIVGLLGIVRSL